MLPKTKDMCMCNDYIFRFVNVYVTHWTDIYKYIREENSRGNVRPSTTTTDAVGVQKQPQHDYNSLPKLKRTYALILNYIHTQNIFTHL